MRMAPLAASAVVAAVLVFGCGSSGTPTGSAGSGGPSAAGQPAGTQTPATTPSPPPGPMVWVPEWADARTPQQVLTRRPLPFCGIEEAPVPRPGEYFDATVRNCFWAARLDGREAEFVSVQPTMEGDRIATIYRLRSDGGVEMLLDSTQDRFGGGGWTSTTCEELVREEGDRLFGVDKCGEPRPI